MGIRQALRIGLLGGTFDPVHTGHLKVAQAAIHELALDTLVWIPANPWQKSATADASHRVRLLRLATSGASKQIIDTSEIDRNAPSYTYETVERYRRLYPEAELYLVIGEDQFANFHTWVRFEAILRQTRLAVYARRGAAAPDADFLATLQKLNQSPIRLKADAFDVSSTAIREAFRSGHGEECFKKGLLPENVYTYIVNQHLYR
ncbi:MAG TPA: nicotinate (nicotinamide) nucleotide adenylyltransferase [Sutterella sp.]|nr:nicotinate (nicotinamide) nucleotide adenylyltransferase [Sutterella sp.]